MNVLDGIQKWCLDQNHTSIKIQNKDANIIFEATVMWREQLAAEETAMDPFCATIILSEAIKWCQTNEKGSLRRFDMRFAWS